MVELSNANADIDNVGTKFYNGRSTIRSKVQLASNEVNGIMIWELGQDSFSEYSLLKTIHKEYDKLEIWHADYKLEINYIYKKFINMIKNTKIVMNTSYEDIYTEFVYMLYYSYHKENIHIKD